MSEEIVQPKTPKHLRQQKPPCHASWMPYKPI